MLFLFRKNSAKLVAVRLRLNSSIRSIIVGALSVPALAKSAGAFLLLLLFLNVAFFTFFSFAMRSIATFKAASGSLIINTEATQVIHDIDTTSDLTLQFGDTLGKTLSYDRSPGNFQFNDNLGVSGTFSATGTGALGALRIREGGTSPQYYSDFRGGDQASNITYTLPTTSATGLLKNTSGVLSWDTNTYYKSGDNVSFGTLGAGAITGASEKISGKVLIGTTVDNGFKLEVDAPAVYNSQGVLFTDGRTTKAYNNIAGTNSVLILNTLDDTSYQLGYVDESFGKVANYQEGHSLVFDTFDIDDNYIGTNDLLGYGGYAVTHGNLAPAGIYWISEGTIGIGAVPVANFDYPPTTATITVNTNIGTVGIGSDATSTSILNIAGLPTGTLASPPAGIVSGDVWEDTTTSTTYPILRIKN